MTVTKELQEELDNISEEATSAISAIALKSFAQEMQGLFDSLDKATNGEFTKIEGMDAMSQCFKEAIAICDQDLKELGVEY